MTQIDKTSPLLSRYEECLAFILKEEGGYANNKADRGGPTNRGITQRKYDEWQERHGLPLQDIRRITHSEVEAIYRGAFWNQCDCPNLHIPIDLVVFDSAVQHGPGRAAKWLQHVVGAAVDGVIGFKTLYAVNDNVMRGRIKTIVSDYLDLRSAFYSGIIARDPTQKIFERGWRSRMVRLEAATRT